MAHVPVERCSPSEIGPDGAAYLCQAVTDEPPSHEGTKAHGLLAAGQVQQRKPGCRQEEGVCSVLRMQKKTGGQTETMNGEGA